LMIEATRNNLRLPDEVTQVFLPLLVSVFRVTASIVICVGVAFIAWLYGMTLQPEQLLTVALLSIVLGLAMPGVPGAGVLVTASVLPAIGLPAEALPILLALDAAADMFRTATNVTGHLALSVLATRLMHWRRSRPLQAGAA
jgi:proton glutamate symport protein